MKSLADRQGNIKATSRTVNTMMATGDFVEELVSPSTITAYNTNLLFPSRSRVPRFKSGELPDLFLIGSISKRLFECKGGDSSFFAKRPYRSTLAVYGSSVGDKKHLARTHARAADHPSLCMHATLKDGEKKK